MVSRESNFRCIYICTIHKCSLKTYHQTQKAYVEEKGEDEEEAEEEEQEEEEEEEEEQEKEREKEEEE